jgi:hypothetical protein
MANLLNQNIGTNYKGILNLNTLNGNLSGTLQAVTDGMGNSSPLKLSTTNLDIGIFTFLGGITSSFPAIKRNAAAIDFRLADDSAFCSINAFGATFSSTLITSRVEMNGDYMGFNGNAAVTTQGNGIFTFIPWSGSNFRLNIGGTTNAFPAIKRNGAGIDFRLADDSGYADLNAKEITSRHSSNASLGFLAIDAADKKALLTGSGGSNAMPSVGTTSAHDFGILVYQNHAARFTLNLSLIIGGAYNVTEQTSAILQLESTTRGFLPPRMTTSEVNSIATPAEGLVVYSTTENQLCLYNGTAWRKLNDSPL